MPYNESLEHYGVKGMKWDVRKRVQKKLDRDGIVDISKGRIVDVRKNQGRNSQSIDVIKGRIHKGRITGRRRDSNKPAKFAEIQKKTKKLIDKMMPKLSNVSFRDINNQPEYSNIIRRKIKI